MTLDFGDVLVVPFPFTNQIAAKRRPAVVVSRRVYNDTRPDVILMAITTQVRPPGAIGEFEIVHWQEAGLFRPSLVKPIFATFQQNLIVRRLGALSSTDKKLLRETITSTLG